MSVLTIEVLKKIIGNLPSDYEVVYDNKKTISPVEDRIEIDVGNRKIILKWFSFKCQKTW